jgi:hypothetical protein
VHRAKAAMTPHRDMRPTIISRTARHSPSLSDSTKN